MNKKFLAIYICGLVCADLSAAESTADEFVKIVREGLSWSLKQECSGPTEGKGEKQIKLKEALEGVFRDIDDVLLRQGFYNDSYLSLDDALREAMRVIYSTYLKVEKFAGTFKKGEDVPFRKVSKGSTAYAELKPKEEEANKIRDDLEKARNAYKAKVSEQTFKALNLAKSAYKKSKGLFEEELKARSKYYNEALMYKENEKAKSLYDGMVEEGVYIVKRIWDFQKFSSTLQQVFGPVVSRLGFEGAAELVNVWNMNADKYKRPTITDAKALSVVDEQYKKLVVELDKRVEKYKTERGSAKVETPKEGAPKEG